MAKLEALTPENASTEAKGIFDALKKKLGMVPNLYATIAHSPAALNAILGYGEALGKGTFSPKEVEAIALAVSQSNECNYCLAAHTAVGKMQGFKEEETLQLRKAEIEDAKLSALTKLAQNITETKGHPDQKLIDDFYAVGYDKGALVDLIGFVSLNVFNNYVNHIADTEIDFPTPPALS